MSKKVLVTGAFGFVGRNVARHFASLGWSVIGIGHGNWSEMEFQEWGLLNWKSAEITIETLKSFANFPEVIIHCAGSGSVGYSIIHPFQDFQRNVNSTIELLEFVRKYSPQSHVVFPSSAGVYGVAEKFPISESAKLLPVSAYGTHKKIAEELCQSYAKNYGIATSIVRLFSVYGNGLQKQLLWDACKKISQGETEFFGTGKETRDWLHISDAVTLLFAASENASSICPIVNGGAGEEVMVEEVLSELFTLFKRKEPPIFSGIVRKGDPTNYQADISLALKWDWKPRRTWRKGVSEYALWFMSNTL